MIEWNFPNRIKSNLQDYLFLINEYHKIKDINSEDIHFNFSKTTWFDANVLALMGAMADNLHNKGNKIIIANLAQEIEKLFRRNNFLNYFGHQPLQDTYDSTVKYKRFDTSDVSSFDRYLESDLFSKSDFPKTSTLLGKKIREISTL